MPHTSLRKLSLTTALLLASGLSAAHADTIVIGIPQEPTTLDPTADATSSIDGMLTQNVFETLTVVDESGEPHPQLAQSWEISEDGLTYVFKLQEGVKFHDGSAFDASDVVYSFDRAMSEDSVNPAKRIFSAIEKVEATGDFEVTITLNKRNAFFLFNMAQGDAAIVGEETVEGNATTPIGTGPFRFESWLRGDNLVLVKNEDWRGAADVALEKVTFRFVTDAAAATSAMLAGEIDAYPDFPAAELMAQFQNDARFKVQIGSTEAEVVLVMNNARAPFDKLDVRRAVSTAIDREEIIAGAMYGLAQPIGSFYPPHGPAYVDLTGAYPHDTAKAAETFKAEGVTGPLKLQVPPFPYAIRSAEIVQAQMAEAGVEVAVETVEWGFWLEEIYGNHNYDMTIVAQAEANDIGSFARGLDYYWGYDNPAFNALWAEISQEIDNEKRYALLRKAQEIVTEDAVQGYLFQMPALGVMKTGVEGLWVSSPVQYAPLASVTFKQD